MASAQAKRQVWLVTSPEHGLPGMRDSRGMDLNREYLSPDGDETTGEKLAPFMEGLEGTAEGSSRGASQLKFRHWKAPD
jgi:hypothetical protein